MLASIGGQGAAQVEFGARDGDLDGQAAGEVDRVPAAAAGCGVSALQAGSPVPVATANWPPVTW